MTEELLAAIAAAGASRPVLPRVRLDGYGGVMKRKEEIPAALPGISSIRDFGGCYLVHGRYLLHATRVRRLSLASMVDINPLPEFAAAVERTRIETPGTEFETVQGDFRDPALLAPLRETDAALLYEVILHQENYVDVLRNVGLKTRKYICLAQPCLREELFPLPCAAVMLQFWDEGLKDVVRAGGFWPREPPVDRFSSAYWMWGQTVSHLTAVMRGLGWGLREGEIVEEVCGPCWEYALLVFARA